MPLPSFPNEDAFREKVLRKSGSNSTWLLNRNSIMKFKEFCDQEYRDNLQHILDDLKTNNSKVYRICDAFAGFLVKTDLMPGSIKATMVGVKRYLLFMGAEISNEKWKSEITLPGIDEIPDVPISRETLRTILTSDMSMQGKAIVSGLKDTGCRINEFLSIQFSDLHLDENPARIEIKKEYVKATRIGRRAREVFLTDESKDFFHQYLKTCETHEGRVFGYVPNDFRTMLIAVLKRLGLDARIEGHKFHQIHPHVLGSGYSRTPHQRAFQKLSATR
jgi:integrase